MIRKSGEALPCVHSRRQQGYKSVSVCVYDVLLGFRPSYGCDSADPASVCTQHAGPQEGVLCTPSFQRTHRGQAGGYLRSASGMCSVYRGARLGLGCRGDRDGANGAGSLVAALRRLRPALSPCPWAWQDCMQGGWAQRTLLSATYPDHIRC